MSDARQLEMGTGPRVSQHARSRGYCFSDRVPVPISSVGQPSANRSGSDSVLKARPPSRNQGGTGRHDLPQPASLVGRLGLGLVLAYPMALDGPELALDRGPSERGEEGNHGRVKLVWGRSVGS